MNCHPQTWTAWITFSKSCRLSSLGTGAARGEEVVAILEPKLTGGQIVLTQLECQPTPAHSFGYPSSGIRSCKWIEYEVFGVCCEIQEELCKTRRESGRVWFQPILFASSQI